MRLDLYLARSRLVPRRSKASEACRLGLVLRNGRRAKPGETVQPGDELVIFFNDRTATVEITRLPEHNTRKSEARFCYRLIEEKPVDLD